MIFTIFALLIVYQLKHYLADFLLQGQYMLGKFKPDWGFVKPLGAHCAVHAAFTLVIACYVNPSYWWLAFVDFAVHFVMDRIKAAPHYLGRFEAISKMEFYLMRTGRGIIAGDDAKLTVADVNQEYIDRKMKSNVFFWWSLGLDQMVHSLTHYFIIFMLVKDMSEGVVLAKIGIMILFAPIILPLMFLATGVLVYFLYKLVLHMNREVFNGRKN